MKLSLAEYRDITKAGLLERKVESALLAAVPAETEHVDLLLIDTGTQASALEAKQRLDSGVSFGDVATSVSTDNSKASGGGLGFVPRGALDPAVEAAAFSLPLGAISPVIETETGFIIVSPQARETRPVDASWKAAVAERQMKIKLNEAAEKLNIKRPITPDQIARIGANLTNPRVSVGQ
jgi:parvulin-like peptidyl-prolyl isomerase